MAGQLSPHIEVGGMEETAVDLGKAIAQGDVTPSSSQGPPHYFCEQNKTTRLKFRNHFNHLDGSTLPERQNDRLL